MVMFYYVVPRGQGGAEVFESLGAAKRRADKIDALVREDGLKGKVVHGAGRRESVPPTTPEQRA